MSRTSNWQKVILQKIIKLNYGKGLPARERAEGKYNVYGSNGVVGNHKTFFVKYPTIIVGRKGSVGKVNLSLQPCWVIDTAFYTEIIDDQVDLRYLYHFLGFVSSKLIAPVGVKPGINRNDYLTRLIPLPFKNGKPDLKEQKRIADKIDKVHLLQEKTEADIKDVDKLINSVFKQEFEKSKNGIKARKLGDLCNIIKGTFPILKTPGGKYTFVVTAEKRKSANRCQFDEEAVCIPLVSSTGHGHASMHRVHYEKGKFALANIMAALIPKDKKLLTKYLYYYLSFYKDNLLVPLMRGGANVTIPFDEVFNVEVAVPRVERQKKLVSVVTKIEELKEKLLEKQNLVNQLFQSTLNQAFQGKI
jgi:restriction endonuclease S subunit